eukprot:3122819-Rhodomonas_salina.1
MSASTRASGAPSTTRRGVAYVARTECGSQSATILSQHLAGIAYCERLRSDWCVCRTGDRQASLAAMAPIALRRCQVARAFRGLGTIRDKKATKSWSGRVRGCTRLSARWEPCRNPPRKPPTPQDITPNFHRPYRSWRGGVMRFTLRRNPSLSSQRRPRFD